MPRFNGSIRFSWRGFNLQLILVAILPLTILLIVVAFGSQMLHHEAMRSMVGERDLRAVRTAADSLNQELNQRVQVLRMFSGGLGASPDLNELTAVYKRMPLAFDAGLAVFSPDGRLLAATPGKLTWEKLPVHDFAFPAPVFSGSSLLGPGSESLILVGMTSGNNVLVGAFSRTDLIAGRLQGAFDPNMVTALVLAAPGPQILYTLGSAEEIGDLATHPGVADALEGQSGINFFQASDGEHLVAFSPIPITGWTLVIEEPWEAATSPNLNVTEVVPLLLVPVLLLAVLALWFGARRVIQPLQTLEKQANHLAEGDFAAILQPVGGIAEIRRLQTQLVNMAEKVKTAQASLHGYIGAITTGVETERRSLARELHDETIQSLIAINQRIHLALPHARTDEEKTALSELQGLTQQAVTNLRRTIRGLRPIYLEDLGLVAALRMLAQEVSQTSRVPIQFEVEGAERRLEPEVELAFYRIAQEALNNIGCHAEAKEGWIKLVFDLQGVKLQVRDDGQGFEVPEHFTDLARLGHYGLLGMAERAELAGAHLQIKSLPDQGTIVTIQHL